MTTQQTVAGIVTSSETTETKENSETTDIQESGSVDLGSCVQVIIHTEGSENQEVTSSEDGASAVSETKESGMSYLHLKDE